MMNESGKRSSLDVSSEGAMEEEKAGAGDAHPPVDASTDAAGAAPISMSKNAAKKAAKARAKAEAKAKARVEKGLDPHPPKNPRQKLVPLLETTRLAKLAGTKRDNPEPPHDPRRCIAIDKHQEAAKIRGVQTNQQGQRSRRRG